MQPLLRRLASLPTDHVVNRSELIGGDSRRERMIDLLLEPEWLAVILLTLVRQGEIILNLRGRRLGVDDLELAAQMGVEEIARFMRHCPAQSVASADPTHAVYRS